MAPSLQSLFSYAGSLLSQFGAQSPTSQFDSIQPRPISGSSSSSYYQPLSGAPSCPIDGPISCHNNTPIAGDSCCFVYPGGRMLLTQFWDQKVHAGGAEEDWTLHGLWPDLCDGTYDQFCHMTPTYNNITDVLEHGGQHELLEFMNRYWLAASGPNSRLWEHEYNKHATCINTLAPTCYGDQHAPGVEVIDYFTRATALFKTLDTYHALEKAGIVPHNRRHYPLVDIQSALETYSGGRVVLRCAGGRGSGSILHEAWYVYFVKGSLQTGEFVPAKDLGREGDAGNCSPWVRYLPKRRTGSIDDL
ncbi:putative ribonuclease T2 precursor [Rhypophila decipiens]|uniref:ribonuclease T2 n=1 Tax=Rhypophila decipiens TaxID=261697 RepID=A0AAN6Y2S9_9PEZI|nr:putative ribonuclease T2 precursor [Rhypophila decipiens]